LRGVEFDYKKTGETNIGFIAQEVAEVIPELVFDGNSKYLSVAYQNFVALLVEAVKEQNNTITDLKDRISKLENPNK